MNKSFLRRLLTTFLFSTIALQGVCIKLVSDDNKLSQWIPEVSGTLRPTFEWQTASGEFRFSVRSARISLSGQIAPAGIDYYYQMDFCDQGKMKVLDFWARIGIVKGLKFQAGQFRQPFGVESFRGPGTYYFVNRSFIGKQMCNVRSVGAELCYTLPSAPFTVVGGIFNPTAIGDHTPWNKKLAYAGKASYKIENVKISGGFQSIIPDGIRTNLADAAVEWSAGRWYAAGEYMYEHYTHNAHRPCHGWVAFADYKMPVKAGIFNYLSFQGRYDGMTNHSNAVRDTNGVLITNDPARQRATLGATLAYLRPDGIKFEIRANYEQYFYHHDASIPVGQDNKLALELVAHF